MVWLIIAGGFFLTAITGLPIGLGLALTGLSILQIELGGATDLAINAVWRLFTDFTLSAVPMFILMGEIMLASGVSSRLYNALAPFFVRLPGQLLHTNIAVSTLFGAVSGTSTSTAAAVGSVAYPELMKRGYEPKMVVGTLAAGGSLGLLIPPSIALLIFGATQQVSIGRLFLAGIIPGLMFAVFFMIWIAIVARRNPALTPAMSESAMPRSRALLNLLSIWPIGFLIFAVLGTIYLGLATPTEAAGLGVVAATVLGFLWGELTLPRLILALKESMQVFMSIGVVILGAAILAQSMQVMGLPYQIMRWVDTLGLSSLTILVVVVAFYLVLGCFFDGISLLLMTLPVVFPLLTSVGYDPVWLGVIVTILIEIGMLTPPVGMNLFVLSGITGNRVTLIEAAGASFPFWILLLFGVGVLTLWPQIALFLPDMFY